MGETMESYMSSILSDRCGRDHDLHLEELLADATYGFNERGQSGQGGDSAFGMFAQAASDPVSKINSLR